MEAIPRAELRFSPILLTRPKLSAMDAVSGLEHFAIVTYAIPAERLRPHVHERFELDCIEGEAGQQLALVSVVPFIDRDFHFHGMPYPRFRFGQTNYRAYVIDRASGKRAVWFFGTSLDSWTVAIPQNLWKLPWHRGRIRFDCHFDRSAGRYAQYRLATESEWAPLELELEDSGLPVSTLTGFPTLESGAVTLTHPLNGIYYRRDGKLGSYSVWHERLALTSGRVVAAKIGLFDRLGLVPFAEQTKPHSVMIQPLTEFTVYLPPRRL